MHILAHLLGLDNASGGFYLFWSGIFGDTVIFAGMLNLYYTHNCHTHNCFRIGKHVVDGTPYCSKHKENNNG